MPTAFLCHSSQDKVFVYRFADDLRNAGIKVWIDDPEIKIGDSLIQKISEGIDTYEYLIAILSPHSVQSPWVQKELSIAMTMETVSNKIKVLPVLIGDCELPAFLIDKRYADFRDPEKATKEFGDLLVAMGVTDKHSLGQNTSSEINEYISSKQTSPLHLLFTAVDNGSWAVVGRDGRKRSGGGGSHHEVVITLKNFDEIYHLTEIGVTDAIMNDFILWEARNNDQWIEVNRTKNKFSQWIKILPEMQEPLSYLWVRTEDGKQFFSERNPKLPEIRPAPEREIYSDDDDGFDYFTASRRRFPI